jgi:hypothetical protein
MTVCGRSGVGMTSRSEDLSRRFVTKPATTVNTAQASRTNSARMTTTFMARLPREVYAHIVIA